MAMASDNARLLLTFDETILPGNAPIMNEYARFGVTFFNAFYDVQGWDLPTGRHIANFSPAVHHPFLQITFAAPVSDASFLFITNREQISSGAPGRSTFQALMNGQVVIEFVGDTDTQQAFGFMGPGFDQIRVYPGGWGNFGRLDNLAFQFVPEPSSGCLALLVLFILITVARAHGRRPSIGINNYED
jgi:hypothetical protein